MARNGSAGRAIRSEGEALLEKTIERSLRHEDPIPYACALTLLLREPQDPRLYMDGIKCINEAENYDGIDTLGTALDYCFEKTNLKYRVPEDIIAKGMSGFEELLQEAVIDSKNNGFKSIIIGGNSEMGDEKYVHKIAFLEEVGGTRVYETMVKFNSLPQDQYLTTSEMNVDFAEEMRRLSERLVKKMKSVDMVMPNRRSIEITME